MEAGRDRGYVAGSQEMPGVTRMRRGEEGCFPEPSLVEWLCLHLQFRLPASRTERKRISNVLGQVCGSLLSQPQETKNSCLYPDFRPTSTYLSFSFQNAGCTWNNMRVRAPTLQAVENPSITLRLALPIHDSASLDSASFGSCSVY